MVADKVKRKGRLTLTQKNACLCIFQIWLYNQGLLAESATHYNEIEWAIEQGDESILTLLATKMEPLKRTDFVEGGYLFGKVYFGSSGFYNDCNQLVEESNMANLTNNFWPIYFKVATSINKKYATWKLNNTEEGLYEDVYHKPMEKRQTTELLPPVSSFMKEFNLI